MYLYKYTKGRYRYAELLTSKRAGKKTSKDSINLGRIIDEDGMIFRNRKDGCFRYDPETGTKTKIENPRKNELPAAVDFGDSFFISEVMKSLKIDYVIDGLTSQDSDSLKAIVTYYLCSQNPNVYANEWLAGNYARFLYPKANLSDQRISELLKRLGTEEAKKRFLKLYYAANDFTEGVKILIDSTGVINSMHLSITMICNHNGQVSNCFRLITAIREEDSKPVYYRIIPGAVPDVSTLKKIIYVLKEYGISISYTYVDAGYSSGININKFLDEKIDFMVRLDAKEGAYARLKKKWSGRLECRENYIFHNGRYFFIAEDTVEIDGHDLYAYVCKDVSSQAAQTIKNADRGTEAPVAYDIMMEAGFFIILTSKKNSCETVLHDYYIRQKIEQSYDLSKNETNLLPVRTHSLETLNGHMMVSFICQVISQDVQNRFKGEDMAQNGILMALRNQKALVYQSELIPLEATKKANDAYRKYKIKFPDKVKITSQS